MKTTIAIISLSVLLACLTLTAQEPAHTPPKPKAGSRLMEMFQKLDKDGDGKLSREEGRVLTNFGEMDTDKDGFLTPQEISTFYAPKNKSPIPPSLLKRDAIENDKTPPFPSPDGFKPDDVPAGDPGYPSAASTRLGDCRPRRLATLGNLAHLDGHLLALFCSGKCPGNLIIDTYDLARALRDAGVTVISGFHTSMEKECLDLLLRGEQPIVVCPARGIHRMRIPPAWKRPLESGRLLILSPFGEKDRRVTADLAVQRNRFVATLADEIFIAHAAPGSKTDGFCQELIAQKKSVFVFNRKDNQRLLDSGACAFDLSEFLRGRGVSGRKSVSPDPLQRDMAWQS